MNTKKTPSNNQVVLRKVLSDTRSLRAPNLSESEYFECFTADQVLKDFELSDDEILQGIVDGGDDGGVDAVYIFIDGQHIAEDADVPTATDVAKQARIQLFVIQSKQENTFKAKVFETAISSAEKLLDLEAQVSSNADMFNESVRMKFGTYRKAVLDLAVKHPVIDVSWVYACLGETKEVVGNIEARRKQLEGKLKDLVGHQGSAVVECVGSQELLNLYHTIAPISLQLQLKEAPISSQNKSYVALALLSDYVEFISSEDGSLRRNLFDENVRDYQGDTSINKAIGDFLSENNNLDFWWLNNGASILTTKDTLNGKLLTLESVRIVNGLQTSYVLHQHKTDLAIGENAKKSVLLRIIRIGDDDARDSIIRATNTQNDIPQASLRATDPFHRSIESYFKSQGMFYERRKSYYKNEKKPLDKIVSIGELAQAVMSVVLTQPDNARARPSSLLKDDLRYEKVFKPDRPIDIYLNSIRLVRKVEDYLKRAPFGFTGAQRTNLKYHLAYMLALYAAQPGAFADESVSNLDLNEITDLDMEGCLTLLLEAIDGQMALTEDSMDKVCKGPWLPGKIKEIIADL